MNRPRLKHERSGVWHSPFGDLTLQRVDRVGPRGGKQHRWIVEGVDGEYRTLAEAANAHRDRIEGIVYLIHFDRPFQHARHYIGWTGVGTIDARLAAHRAGQGANLLKHVNLAGIAYDVVRVWAGDRFLERRLKRRGGAAQLCPVCAAAERERRNANRRARYAQRAELQVAA